LVKVADFHRYLDDFTDFRWSRFGDFINRSVSAIFRRHGSIRRTLITYYIKTFIKYILL
jgi:hypothetical protein